MNFQQMTRRSAVRTLACVAAAGAASGVLAQTANNAITWVVPYAPGAATDALARVLAEGMGQDLKRSVVVENVGGAGTAIAAAQLARQTPDGSRIMTADIATLAITPVANPKAGYDPLKSFTHIGMIAHLPFVLVSNVQTGPKDLGEMLRIARDQPGKLNYGSAGLGSPHHLAMELLMEKAQGQMVHIPFKGTGPAMTELLAGRIDVMFATLGSVAAHVKSGTLRAIAVSSPARFTQLPQVPTVAEQGMAGYEAAAWQGVVAPAGLAANIRDQFNASLQRVLASESTRRRMNEMGIEPITGTPQQFEQYARQQFQLWSALIRSRGIKLD
ncbi:MAG: tripartite tricarboxylate transporter substrate binding protein [Pseudomonadota bacterium]